jgi:hypothetical protein
LHLHHAVVTGIGDDTLVSNVLEYKSSYIPAADLASLIDPRMYTIRNK